MDYRSPYDKLREALSIERTDMRNQSRYDDLMEAAERTARTLIFSLGVIKAAELVFKKRFL